MDNSRNLAAPGLFNPGGPCAPRAAEPAAGGPCTGSAAVQQECAWRESTDQYSDNVLQASAQSSRVYKVWINNFLKMGMDIFQHIYKLYTYD